MERGRGGKRKEKGRDSKMRKKRERELQQNNLEVRKREEGKYERREKWG